MDGNSRTKKTKCPNNNTASQRYWSSGRLKIRKIKNLVKCGFTVEEALRQWDETRKRHRDLIDKCVGLYEELMKLKKYER